MSEIPIQLRRKFQQLWASKFVLPVAAAEPKSTALKGIVNRLRSPSITYEVRDARMIIEQLEIGGFKPFVAVSSINSQCVSSHTTLQKRQKQITGAQSRLLHVGARVCWRDDRNDQGTVTETNWSGVTLKWDNRSQQSVLHNDMAFVGVISGK